MSQSFGERLRAGDILRGTLLALPSPAAAEVIAGTGFDWLFIDGEHGPFDAGSVTAVLQAVDRRLHCVVRIPRLDVGTIKQTLDLGAAGIIVPQVNTPNQAAQVVEYAKYAPLGNRGVGLARAHDYGNDFAGYLSRANQSTGVIVQAEHIEAVENIDAIAATEGIDAVFVGPYDLSASLGHTGQLDHPEVVAAIDHITRSCQAAGMPLGIFGMSAAAVKPYMERGYTLLCAGTDVTLLAAAARALHSELR